MNHTKHVKLVAQRTTKTINIYRGNCDVCLRAKKIFQTINIIQRKSFVTGMFICLSQVCAFLCKTPTHPLGAWNTAVAADAVDVVVCRRHYHHHHHHLLLLLIMPLLFQGFPTFSWHYIWNKINQIEFEIDEPCAANFIESSICWVWQRQRWQQRPHGRDLESFTFTMNARSSIMFRWQTMFLWMCLFVCMCICDHNCNRANSLHFPHIPNGSQHESRKELKKTHVKSRTGEPLTRNG